MAHRLILPAKPHGMPFIWNVSQRVGELSSCPNLPTDVELVKALIINGLAQGSKVARAPGVLNPRLTLNSQFDPILGYWIFSSECHAGGHKIIDGIVSPARATGDMGTWMIARYNLALFTGNRKLWESFPELPSLSPQLRSELATKTS